MNGNCHFMVGGAMGVATCLLTQTDATATTLIISTCLIGSIFPDIDSPNSHFGQLTKPLSTIISKFNRKGSQHRGLLHALLIYVCGLILSYLYFKPILGFFIGAISHLFLDTFNPSGIPLLFLYKNRLHLGKVRSDSPYCTCISIIVFVELLFISIDLTLQGIYIPLAML